MSGYSGARVRASQQLRGYHQAVRRFHTAGLDAEAAFFALFETLNWAVALDECQQEPNSEPLSGLKVEPVGTRAGEAGGEVMQAVRYARNRVHHQWADAWWLREGPQTVLPFRGAVWCWRPVDELPPPLSRRGDIGGREGYEALVARDARVAYTLAELETAFGRVVALLEPTRATSAIA
jgi:hypothetical protein